MADHVFLTSVLTFGTTKTYSILYIWYWIETKHQVQYNIVMKNLNVWWTETKPVELKMREKKSLKNILGLIFIIMLVPKISARETLEDYRRADRLKEEVEKRVVNSFVWPTWIGKTSKFWYLNRIQGNEKYMLYNASRKQKSPAFNHKKLAEALSKETGEKIDPQKLPFDRHRIEFKNGGKKIHFSARGFQWSYNPVSNVLKKLEKSEKWQYDWRERWIQESLSKDPVPSPDKKWEAFVRNHNLFIRSVNTKEEYQLSMDGAPGSYYSANILWSPDSKKLITNKVTSGVDRFIHYVTSSPADQLQPKYEKMYYPKPGDIIPIRKPKLFHTETAAQIPVSDKLFPDPFWTGEFKWGENSRLFTFEYNQRGHQVYRVIGIDGETGDARSLVEERSDTFFDYAGKKFRYDISGGAQIIWMSERDGWNHLYLIDAESGNVVRQITKGEWIVRKVHHVNEKDKYIIFEGSGNRPGEDPYFRYLYRVHLDGTGLTCLTPEEGNHRIFLSGNKQYFVDTYSKIDVPPVSVLRQTSDGKILKEIERMNIRKLEEIGWRAPETFHAKGRDGITDIWGIIYKPTHFLPDKKYPVIEYIYAGPHNSFVPKSFRPFRNQQALAELGFIVVQIDGMGTSNRSKAFHDVCWKNLKDAGFPDRICWHKAAAGKFPYMDISNVGIYGTSAGGQSATGALLFFPEFYKVAVASCGCHDNRIDKIWWNELWMGYPVGPQYKASSNTENAHRLQGKLLLILGEMDKNVDPSSTTQLVNALIKADRDFDFLYVPGMGHSSGGTYGERKRRDFFVRHILKKDPPDWNKITPPGEGQ